jgi:hypothetical protein
LARDRSHQFVHYTVAPFRGLDLPADVLAKLPVEPNELSKFMAW